MFGIDQSLLPAIVYVIALSAVVIIAYCIPRSVSQIRDEIIKTQKDSTTRRHLPIHDGFAAELKSWWKADKKSVPIIHYKNKPIKRLQTTWENTLTRSKIKRRLRPYDLRHNFITATLEEGADIGAVAVIVGSSPETLRQHYQHVTNRFRRHTISLLKPI